MGERSLPWFAILCSVSCSFQISCAHCHFFSSEAIKKNLIEISQNITGKDLCLSVGAIVGFICDLMCVLSFFLKQFQSQMFPVNVDQEFFSIMKALSDM